MPLISSSPVTIRFSPELSKRLLEYAAENGRNTIEELTQDVEDMISRRLLLHETESIRERFTEMTPEQVDDLVEEALAWARSSEGPRCE